MSQLQRQPRYRLFAHNPYESPYARRVQEARAYRGYVLEAGEVGVLVSPIFGDAARLDGQYLLFVSLADAMCFVDLLLASTPHPVGRSKPLASPTKAYRLCEHDPLLIYATKWGMYRGYLLTTASGVGCTISHPDLGPYKIEHCYVLFVNEQAARDEIDRWYRHNLLPERVTR